MEKRPHKEGILVEGKMLEICVKEAMCPHCGAAEMHPDGDKVLIRAFKVALEDGYWWSQCLVCSGGYDKDLVWHQDNHNPDKGWF
jgi:hypothetical protein